eukprot:CAMPEP_0174866240 /NCGR_PEP_ID=MMETSP1114-20130205/61758_1 /TAXON_ID=312471 /ORGANISM="Neobodo designis, Strain CCAP 1951/1" /LENGTH=1077 /DNA_ID=CAMNT_0016101391 /DNA_START=72 /DNA_END=3305 /DNA_ORIENTATION=+
MAAHLNWRAFKFFEPELVQKGTKLDDLEITAATCGRNHVYLGDALGNVTVVERSSMKPWTFNAYAGAVTHLRIPRSNRNVLFTIGDENTNDTVVIRTWDLDQRRGSTADVANLRWSSEFRIFDTKHPSPIPMPLRINYNSDVKITFRGGTEDTTFGTSESLTSPVTGFDVSDDLQHMALALTDSRILMVRGELDRERAPLKKHSLTSRHPEGALTFVGFPKLRDGPGGPNAAFHVLLFAVYEDVTVAFPIPPRNKDLSGGVDDRAFEIPRRIGAARDCAALTEDGELVTIADTQVTYVGGEKFIAEKKLRWDGAFAANDMPTPAIEGTEKCKLAVHKHYLVVLTRNDATKKPDKFNIGIFDRESRIKAVTTTVSAVTNPSWVLPDISDVLVISQEGKSDQAKNKMVKLVETTTQGKFDQLFKKDMYEEAKKIAKRLAATGGGKADTYNIERRYGDHLYEKGNYDEAVLQYIEAIKTTEPSYVIRKFLGEQRISNLTFYLEALHRNEHGRLANKNHTTLLLNCYAKLKAEDKMAAFIRREDITFDAVNAIHVCRQAGSYDAATYLAAKYNKPDEYVMILLENLGKHSDALSFIASLPLRDAERIMRAHAKTLLANRDTVREATQLLIRLCTEWVPSEPPKSLAGVTRPPPSSGAGAAAGNKRPARPEPFMPAFVDTPRALLQFLEAIVVGTFRRSPSAPMQPGAFDSTNAEVLGTLLELYLTPHLPERVQHRGGAGGESAAASPDKTEESAATTSPTPETTTAPKERLDKAYELLVAYPGQYDPYHALMLAQQHNFERGVIYMFQCLNLHSEIFVYHAKQFENGATAQQRAHAKAELLKTCEESQAKNPGEATRDMWVSFLSLLVRSPDDVEEDITSLLDRIERLDLLPPVAVIEILSASEKLQLRAVRSYVINMINRDRDVIDRCQREIDEMTDAARTLESEVKSLQTTAQVFQTAKCHQCERPLDTSSAVVYFLCGHSFHESCVTERDCNICGAQHRQHLQAQRDYDAASSNHEAFFNQLREAPDGFSVIADHFGRGIFSSRKAKAAGDLDEFDLDDDDGDLYDAAPEAVNELETW